MNAALPKNDEEMMDAILGTNEGLLNFFRQKKVPAVVAMASIGYFIGSTKRMAKSPDAIEKFIDQGRLIEERVWGQLRASMKEGKTS